MSEGSQDKGLRILYLEDDPIAVEMLRALLDQEGMKSEILHVDSRDSFLNWIGDPHLDLIISDFNLPDIDGFTALELRKRLRPNLPFIFVSGTLGEHTAVETLKKGATDFVLKDALIRLPSVITRALEESREQRLRKEAEHKLQLLFDAIAQSPIAFEIRDARGVVVFANRQLSELTGYTDDELIQMEPHALYRDSTPPELMAEISRSHDSMERWNGDLSIVTKNGDVRHVRGIFSPLKGADGEASHQVSMFEDMTEWKEEQQKRHDLEKQLQQAQKMEAIGSLAGGIAHDFNNILTAIIGFAELSSLSLPPDSEDASNIRQIMMAGRRARDLVSQILSFSRMQETSMAIIDVSHTVTDILRLLRATLPATIEIVRNLESCCVRANPTQLHQVLMNLCTNAEHAMRGKPGRLTIRVQSVELSEIDVAPLPPLKPGRHVCLSIADTGHGMDEATQTRIFDRFFTTKKPGEGSGLGLSVVQKIVYDHRGALRLKSAVGVGTTFEIFLPSARSSMKAEEGPRPPLCRGEGRSVFLLDDEVSIVTFLAIRLQRLGFVTRTFRVPSEVLEALVQRKEHADLLFTDQTMPGMTGVNLIRTLRASGCKLPVVLASGYGSDLNPADFEGLKGVTKIDKPFTEESLATALYKALG